MQRLGRGLLGSGVCFKLAGVSGEKQRVWESYRRKGMKKGRVTMLGALLAATLFLGGAGKDNIVMLDSRQYILYQNVTVDTMLEDYSRNKNIFSQEYDGGKLAIWGKVASVTSDGRSFTMTGLDGASRSITCKVTDARVMEQVKKLQPGSEIKALGEVEVSFFLKDVSLAVDGLEGTDGGSCLDNQYSTLSGGQYDLDNMLEVELQQGMIKYSIPQSWADVTKELENKTLEGHQYCLNEINQSTAKAESLFVFYFDNAKGLKNLNDRTRTKEIQVAIINNILKKDAGSSLEFTREDFKTYYGASYNYYGDTYTNAESNETYRVEFVFESLGEEGVLVYLYVVNNENENRHIEDIMMVMKSAGK